MCILDSIRTPFRKANTAYWNLKETSHWNTPPTPVEGFTTWKTQIPISKATVAKTKKYKRHTGVALKKEMKPPKKCNMAKYKERGREATKLNK